MDRIEKGMKNQDDVISDINSIFYTGKYCKYTYEEILKWIGERTYQLKSYKKLPQYRKYYIYGYIRANFHIIETSMIEQKIEWNGELINTKDERLSGHWAEIDKLSDEKKPKMYWKGTDKVYY